jgi:virginiamycin B lyase
MRTDAQNITEYSTPFIATNAITTGTDGALWFTDGIAGPGPATPPALPNHLGRLTTDAAFSTISPPAGHEPGLLAPGPDGAVWFSFWPGQIGRASADGTVVTLPIPDEAPYGITAGPGGALWVTAFPGIGGGGNSIDRITTTGEAIRYSIPTPNCGPWAIVTGPDGALWFTESAANKIGRLTTTGLFTEFSTSTLESMPTGLTVGPDAALWFTETIANKIGRINADGQIKEFLIPGVNPKPTAITAGPDGALWFTEFNAGSVGRITTDGGISTWPIPTPGATPNGIAVGPDGNIWFTEGNNKIGQVLIATPGPPLLLGEGHFRVTVAWSAVHQGTSGVGQPVSLTQDAGYFWFFTANNVELLVKVVDGRVVNGHFWVFAGALSNVQYTISVTDTLTGVVKTYFNAQDARTSVTDTEAF